MFCGVRQIQRLFAEVLLRPGKDLYLRLPVPYGKAVTRDNVVRTCEAAGFRPICRNRDESWSGDCFKMELGQNKDSSTYRLIREVCQDLVQWDDNETPTSLCPKIYGTFFYMHNLTNEDRSLEYTSTGLLMRSNGSTWLSAWGTNRRSGEESKPYFAACAKEGGIHYHLPQGYVLSSVHAR